MENCKFRVNIFYVISAIIRSKVQLRCKDFRPDEAKNPKNQTESKCEYIFNAESSQGIDRISCYARYRTTYESLYWANEKMIPSHTEMFDNCACEKAFIQVDFREGVVRRDGGRCILW